MNVLAVAMDLLMSSGLKTVLQWIEGKRQADETYEDENNNCVPAGMEGRGKLVPYSIMSACVKAKDAIGLALYYVG